MYRVFENGKRCNDYGIEGWDNDTFETLEQAIVYANKWCYTDDGPCLHMDVGKEYDMGTFLPVMMKIEQV